MRCTRRTLFSSSPNYCLDFLWYSHFWEEAHLTAGFAGFYISEVIKNVVHATISGIYGAYYVFSKLLHD